MEMMPPFNPQRRRAAEPADRLGSWQGDGTFRFDSPEAEQRWAVEAYRSGMHAGDWHRGTPLDDKTRDVVLSGLGGPTAPVFRGPDGQYRFANINTIEPEDVRAVRQQAFRAAKSQDLTGPEMPGEDVIAARHAAKAAPVPPPANDNPPPATGVGRFAAMAQAQKDAAHPSPQEALQAIDDGVRLLANGATLGYADNVAAAGNALFGAGSFAEDYLRNLAQEQAQSAAARERTGKVGAVLEALPGMIPVYGDALALIGDTKQYIEHPETATIGNLLGTAATVAPWTPNVLGPVRKVENTLEEAARAEGKVAGKIDDLPEKPKADNEAPPELPAPKPDQIRIDLNDPASVDAYFKRPIKGNEGPDGHAIERHIGKTKEELADRLRKEPRISASSSFPNEETANIVAYGALKQNEQRVLKWLRDPNRGEITLPYVGKDVVGISGLKNGTAIDRANALVHLRKDGQGGFYYLTAYPN